MVRIEIAPETRIAIEVHCYSEINFEVGGVLLGRTGRGKTVIEDFIPALNADKADETFTFTHEVWSEITRLKKFKNDKLQIVGWFHTHPGFSVNLSKNDIFIHNGFFSKTGQVALVVDPIEGTYAWHEASETNYVSAISNGKTYLGPHSWRVSLSSQPSGQQSSISRLKLWLKIGVLLSMFCALFYISALLHLAAHGTLGFQTTGACEASQKVSSYENHASNIHNYCGQNQFVFKVKDSISLRQFVMRFYGSIDYIEDFCNLNADVCATSVDATLHRDQKVNVTF